MHLRLVGSKGAADKLADLMGRNAGLMHPPTLVLSFDDGRTLEIGLLKSIGTPNISRANNTVRDEMILAISQQLAPIT